MKRKFVTNLALLLSLNLLVKPFWMFGIDRKVQNIVGVDEYGFYISLFSFSLLLNFLLDIGITNFNNRNIAQHSQLLSKYFSNLVVLKFSLAVIYLITSLTAAYFVGYDSSQFKLLLFLTFNQFLLSFILYLRSNISGLHLFRTDSLISVLDRTIMIGICAVLIWGNVTEAPFQIEWFVYAQTSGYFLTAFITFLVVVSKTKFLKLKFDWIFFRLIFKQSYPFALLVLLMTLYWRVDSVMLERLLGKEHAGIYAQSFRILDAVSMFALLFANLLLPIFSRMIKQKEPVVQMVQLSFLLLVIPAIIIAITSSVYGYEIINLMYHEHIETSSRIFSILILGFIPISITYIFGTLLTANGSLKALNIMALGGMIMNIGLNFLLIPRYGAFGSAVASFATQSFTAIVQILIARKIFGFSLNYKLLTAIFFFITGVFLLAWFSFKHTDTWIITYIAIIILSISLAFLLKLLNLHDLYKIIRFGDS